MKRRPSTVAELEATAYHNMMGMAEIPLQNPYPDNAAFTEGYELLVSLVRQRARELAKRRKLINTYLYGG